MIGTAQVDRSGRLQHSRILQALRWRPGDELLVDIALVPADDGIALLITPEHDQNRSVATDRHPTRHAHRRTSRCRIDARGAITLPAAARALCGIGVGSTIVVVAEPASNRLIVQSTTVAVRLLVEHLDGSHPGAPCLRPSRPTVQKGTQDER